MKKTFVLYFLIALLSIGIVYSHEHNIKEAKALIDSRTSCNELSDEQLEMIGEYYMEQMHPGEAHEAMDEMMGGEGSESLRQMHVNIARSFYCRENEAMSSGMMDMMMGRSNMINSGGMIGTLGYGFGYWNFVNILYIILLIGLIILVYLWIIRLLKNTKNRVGKK